MSRRSSVRKCPPAVGATEGQSTALEACANPTYGTDLATGKHFRGWPDFTGNNRRSGSAGTSEDNVQPIWEWPKRGGEIRAGVKLYRGTRYLDVRWWIASPFGFRPTQKGVTIPLEAVRDFTEALCAYEAGCRSEAA